ncbi:hypothetical protein FK220_013370 [Flavobacteriaceae bacterium TP-CH-4]|uniref:DUF4252 domain-containing protein n=1 Tax=Pelagihabitans pacificus TaxID=2696054 RepID=A0A967AU63_9FLAO|nr:hypothetical protein [Pelagihabitans pacificus]NHF60338.1 hypothetical protein [Pelagihabitans pacificus]
MKNVLSISCLVFLSVSGLFAQTKEKENTFLLGFNIVKVYDFESSPKSKGFFLVDVFEDDYRLKLTRKTYKVNLVFDEARKEAIQRMVSKVLDGEKPVVGYDPMIWKGTTQNGAPMYEIKLEGNNLKMRIYRKHIDSDGFSVINRLGTEFLKEINS